MQPTTIYMDAGAARQAVAESGRLLLNKGLVARTWGNVSCRTSADSFVITPSGLGYDVMTAEDIVAYSMADGAFTGTRKPSSEKGVHAAAYAQFPDAGFVIHTHQTYASALGLAGFEALTLSAAQSAALGGVALARYGLPGTKALRRHVASALQSGAHCVLMAHHGALIVGRDREEAFLRAEKLEELCRTACLSQPAEARGDTAQLAALAERAAAVFGHAAFTASPAVIAASGNGPIPAQLDDMAQMIGPRMISVSPDKLPAALHRHEAVLVRGLGAVCRARTAGDADALCLLADKAAVAFLHTRACGVRARLSPFDTALMRRIYKKKYARKIGG